MVENSRTSFGLALLLLVGVVEAAAQKAPPAQPPRAKIIAVLI